MTLLLLLLFLLPLFLYSSRLLISLHFAMLQTASIAVPLIFILSEISPNGAFFGGACQ